jgi:predicted  nucleic acid-binding Zn-ribbon protein
VRLTAIRAENYLRIREIDVAPQHPITLFAGDNDVGKSSMREAIKLALLREADRVKLKKHWSHLVRRGAKSASVVIEWTNGKTNGRASIALPSGDGNCTPEIPPAVAFALDAPRFAALEEDKRRKFLFDLIGIGLDVPSVKERLLKRGCRPDLIEQVVPILRTGFPSAHTYAEDKQREFRAKWCSLTGEDYGHKKAETWRAPLTATEVNREQISGLQDSITNISAEITATTKQIGAGEAYLQHKSRYDREARGLQEQAKIVTKRKKDMDDAERKLASCRETLEANDAKLADARLTGQPCPSCGTVLSVKSGGKLIESPAVGKKELSTLEATVDGLRSAQRVCQETFTRAKSDYDAAVTAAETLAQLEQAMGTPTTAERLATLKKQEAELEHEVESLTSKLTELQNQVREIDAAQKKTADAKAAHQLVQAWGLIAEALAPDGIPGDLLAEALGPINRRLKKSADVTGWPPAKIQDDMEITVGEIPYTLCGESVRWRADAMLAEAIAHAAGVKMLVLDRLDVLHPDRRGDAINWFFQLVEDDGYETIIAFATLKKKPALEGVNVYWLEDGKV